MRPKVLDANNLFSRFFGAKDAPVSDKFALKVLSVTVALVVFGTLLLCVLLELAGAIGPIDTSWGW